MPLRKLIMYRKYHEICSSAPAVRALVITGTGKVFSLGLDLHYFREQGDTYAERTRQEIPHLYRRILLIGVPTVAAING